MSRNKVLTNPITIRPAIGAGLGNLFEEARADEVQTAIDMLADAMIIVLRHPESVIPNEARDLAKAALLKAGKWA